LTEKLGASVPQETLRIEQGNAHDLEAVSRALQNPKQPGSLVDMVIFSIGGAFDFSKFTLDDANVCEKGAKVLLEALAKARAGSGDASQEHTSPRIVVVSSAGISRLGRDMSVLAAPVNAMIKVPHADKVILEDLMIGSTEAYTIIRPTLLHDGTSTKPVRVGIEDMVANKVEKRDIGLRISREAVGKWMFDNLVEETDSKWLKKAVTLTQ
jgi:hypothetical protein